VADYNAVIAPLLFLLALTQAAAAAPFTLTPSPAHARLFAPPHATAAYRFDVTPASIEEVAAFFASLPRRSPSAPAVEDASGRGGTKAAWKVESMTILDVFDGAAMYDRSRLARLYGGKSARVARGPIRRDGAVVGTILLVSPYPDADLRQVNPGTLVMTVEVPR
jgi:hypothetical protein